MKYLEFLYMAIGAMAVIYVIFNIKDFILSWYRWIIAVGKGIGRLSVWLWKKITRKKG